MRARSISSTADRRRRSFFVRNSRPHDERSERSARGVRGAKPLDGKLMRAVIKTERGPGNLAVLDAPVPIPDRGEALVRILRSGLCGTDLLVYDDVYRGRRRPVPLPLILGHEAAGELIELGPDSEGPAAGTRVAIEAVTGCGACYQCARGRYNLCQDWHHIGLTTAGALAEYAVVPVSSL